MTYFTLELEFANIGARKTIYCWHARTKYKNDILQAWGNTPTQAIDDLFLACEEEKHNV